MRRKSFPLHAVLALLALACGDSGGPSQGPNADVLARPSGPAVTGNAAGNATNVGAPSDPQATAANTSLEAGPDQPATQGAGLVGNTGAAEATQDATPTPAGASDELAAAGGAAEPAVEDEAPVEQEPVWEELVAGDWNLAGGAEDYYCVRRTVTEDIYIGGFRAINPIGTHHTLLSVVENSVTPDGIAPCASAGADADMIYGSGVGTDDIIFPPGVALKIPAGSQVVSNLHLFNASPEAISGRSGNAFLRLDESDVVDLADNLLAGPLVLNIPPAVEVTEVGGCTMDSEVQIFAVQPHLHQTGVHAKIVAETSEGDVVLHDGPYDFDAQVYYSIDPPVTLRGGQRLRIECTYQNTTERTLGFGASSEDEMCLASVYRFPASPGKETICAF